MSRTGNCYDNAAMERFFWSLKHEWTHDNFADWQALLHGEQDDETERQTTLPPEPE